MIPTFLITKFGPTGAKFAFFGGIAALFALACLLTYCAGRSDGKAGEVNAQLNREIKVQGQIGDANTNAAGARVEDATTIQNQAQELRDATVNASSPEEARLRRGCAIMRQQGRTLPAACQ